ncbi:hypothetical protein IPA_04985 [Ignicoccus pacificus DSM 13166]|uniref:Uncharacterized protein n=1 Tax=Ignicoccus pacificus DSM 13166 TaxID=940294 RepID=A0A977KB74_9CREN|nr:hypothetical protein IPA_04985 [Ignicoccus pacificus DSM 13166]
MVSDVLSDERQYDMIILRRSRNLKKIRLNVERSVIEIQTDSKDPLAMILSLWVYTGKMLYPLLFDVDIVKGLTRSFELVDLKGETLRERSGIVLTSKKNLVDVRDMRNYSIVLKSVKASCSDVSIYPSRSLVLGHRNKVYFMQLGSSRERVVEFNENVRRCAIFPYARLIAAATRGEVSLHYYKGGEWKVRGRFPVVMPKSLEWCLFAGKISLGVDLVGKYSIITIDGDYTSIELGKPLMAKISPFGDKLAVAYPKKLVILDVEKAEPIIEVQVDEVQTMSWSPYGDYLAFCTRNSCSIYSDLTESIVIGKPIRGVRWSWWSPHTLSLYLQTENGTKLIYFDPQMVSSKKVAVRLPTYLRTKA